jgi:outer membrane lipoprotein SlyB
MFFLIQKNNQFIHNREMRMKLNRIKKVIERKMIVIVCLGVLIACSGHTAKRAGEGAAMGAVVGAAGGMVSALVFGGNVGEAAARGAVWGGTTGAVAGGISGAQQEQTIKVQQEQVKKAQQDKAIEKLKADLGENAFNGLAALTDCKHEVALGYARTAAKSDNQNYALAGKWIEILAYADSRQEDKARALYPELINIDTDISSESQAEETMKKALQRLMDIREEYNLPETCN